MAEAVIASKQYSQARDLLDRTRRNSENLGLQVLLAKSQYLLAEVLRLSGNQTEAAQHYAAAHQTLDDIRKEARTDDFLKRSDLSVIYQQSARWQSPKS